jgi:hypothetical protein
MLGLWHRVWLFRVLVCAVVPRDNRVPVSAVSWSCWLLPGECRMHGAWATAGCRGHTATPASVLLLVSWPDTHYKS